MRTRRSPRNQEILWRALGGKRAPEPRRPRPLRVRPVSTAYKTWCREWLRAEIARRAEWIAVICPPERANAVMEENRALGAYAELDGLVILADCNETDLPYWVG